MGEARNREAVGATKGPEVCGTCGRLRAVLADSNLALLSMDPTVQVNAAARLEQLAQQLLATAHAWRVILQFMHAGHATTAAASSAERQCFDAAKVLHQHLAESLRGIPRVLPR